jgi:hypothetical protein
LFSTSPRLAISSRSAVAAFRQRVRAIAIAKPTIATEPKPIKKFNGAKTPSSGLSSATGISVSKPNRHSDARPKDGSGIAEESNFLHTSVFTAERLDSPLASSTWPTIVSAVDVFRKITISLLK